MKRKKITSSLKSSPEIPVERKKRTSSLKSSSQQMVENLPDDCWEYILKFFLKDEGCYYLISLSLVSKQFLSITNSLLFSLTVYPSRVPFLKHLLKRFPNLTSIKLDYNFGVFCDVDNIFRLISSFPLKKLTSLVFTGEPSFPFKKLKSLILSGESIFPADGLRVFSQNITTLTSLTCSIKILYKNDLLLIADCFPLLKELNLEIDIECQTNFKNGTHSLLSKRLLVNNRTDFINGIHSLLSKCRCIHHLSLIGTFFLNDTHVAELSLFLGDLVSINLNDCSRLTESALFSLVRNCPLLSEIKMQDTAIGKESLENSGVYPQLKSLYLGRNDWLRDEKIIMLASFFPNLQLLDLNTCNNITDDICQVLRRCGKIKHLNLSNCPRLKLLKIKFVIPQLEVLNLSYTKVDDETLYAISKNCCGLLELLLRKCKRVTKKGVKHLVENCTQLREIYLGYLDLDLEISREFFLHHGCLLYW